MQFEGWRRNRYVELHRVRLQPQRVPEMCQQSNYTESVYQASKLNLLSSKMFLYATYYISKIIMTRRKKITFRKKIVFNFVPLYVVPHSKQTNIEMHFNRGRVLRSNAIEAMLRCTVIECRCSSEEVAHYLRHLSYIHSFY